MNHRVALRREKMLYVCAPWKTRTPAEEAETKKAVRAALEKGWAPVFLPFMYDTILDESDPEARELGLQACEAVLVRCDKILVIGSRITEGMQRELDLWDQWHSWMFLNRKPLVWPDLPPAGIYAGGQS